MKYLFDPETRSGKFIPVENVIDVSDPYVLWFYIPGYNGYEVSNTLYVRSMKHFNKYPYGMLIQPKKDRKGNIINPEDPSFELSNNQNERHVIKLSQIVHLAKTNPYAVYGFPRGTRCQDIASRNLRCFLKKQIPSKQLDTTKRYPKFTVIDEADPDDPYKIRMKEDLVIPIHGIDGNTTNYSRYQMDINFK